MAPITSAIHDQALAPVITHIDHVGIAVPDLDQAVDFYRRTFGVQVVHEEINEEQGVREAMLAVGDGFIQLLAPLRADSPIGRFLERQGPGIQQVAFGVDDVQDAARRLRAAGVRMLYEEAKTGTAGSLVNFAHPKDCGGVLIELVQAGGGHGNFPIPRGRNGFHRTPPRTMTRARGTAAPWRSGKGRRWLPVISPTVSPGISIEVGVPVRWATCPAWMEFEPSPFSEFSSTTVISPGCAADISGWTSSSFCPDSSSPH